MVATPEDCSLVTSSLRDPPHKLAIRSHWKRKFVPGQGELYPLATVIVRAEPATLLVLDMRRSSLYSMIRELNSFHCATNQHQRLAEKLFRLVWLLQPRDPIDGWRPAEWLIMLRHEGHGRKNDGFYLIMQTKKGARLMNECGRPETPLF